MAAARSPSSSGSLLVLYGISAAHLELLEASLRKLEAEMTGGAGSGAAAGESAGAGKRAGARSGAR
jgi:hypothetical protein